ncbi:hypothetical protein DFH07DRAFT_810829 [Mycena maculata]|uniref:Uncharacterized protein n=1 Tax=Mycena maculata TaxID=230809 RepID=A0AAD7JIH8_9AGAR|nr:hypothetical protein DFH07DRAFT_810829 [Mycena maculata]
MNHPSVRVGTIVVSVMATLGSVMVTLVLVEYLKHRDQSPQLSNAGLKQNPPERVVEPVTEEQLNRHYWFQGWPLKASHYERFLPPGKTSKTASSMESHRARLTLIQYLRTIFPPTTYASVLYETLDKNGIVDTQRVVSREHDVSVVFVAINFGEEKGQPLAPGPSEQGMKKLRKVFFTPTSWARDSLPRQHSDLYNINDPAWRNPEAYEIAK